jgi:adenylate kinase
VTSTGAMLRDEKRRQTPLGIEAAQLTNDGKLLPDDIVIRLLQTWLEQNEEQWVLDGFPGPLARQTL